MSSDIASEIKHSASGHWAVISTEASSTVAPDREFLQSLQEKSVDQFSLQVTGVNSLMDVETHHKISTSDFLNYVRTAVSKAKKQHVVGIRFVIAEFGQLPVDAQCRLLLESRGVRETAADLRCQFIVCGQWNFYRFRQHWKSQDDFRAVASPVLDTKARFFVSSYKTGEIISELQRKNVLGLAVTDTEALACSLLEEATAGDRFLVRYIVGYLAARRLSLVPNIESILQEMIDAGEVVDEIERRVRMLDDSGTRMLWQVLRYQYLVVPNEAIEAEDLRLVGLISAAAADSSNIRLSIVSPVVEQVLRNNCQRFYSGTRAFATTDLSLNRIVINTAAYRMILNIENSLRNLIVSELSAEAAWPDAIKPVKTLSKQARDESEELKQLVQQLVDAQLCMRGLASEERNVQPEMVSDQPFVQRQESILDAAQNWRKRQDENASVELIRPGLPAFFTTESLVSILTNKNLFSIYFKRYFPKKETLVTFLEAFVATRAAVAHNQPIGLSTIARLEQMNGDLIKWISSCANNSLKQPVALRQSSVPQ